ncbi:MAG TPA: hypothetical protein VJ975_03830, partial [Candidatus Limnocylindria bacterium]|nr:hypothetical protein [Candidatus Limnocylindria bacterium]
MSGATRAVLVGARPKRENAGQMGARVSRRARGGVPLLLALLGAGLLAPLPLPRSTAMAPVHPAPAALAAAAAPADLLAVPQRWPHVDAHRSRPIAPDLAADLAAALERARAEFHVYGAQLAVSWDGERSWAGATGVMR